MTSNTEHIQFEIFVKPQFWKDPPHLSILIDNQEKHQSLIEHSQVIRFRHTLALGTHQLTMIRTGKSNQQVRLDDQGNHQGQELFIEWIKIDGVNIRNLVWTNSYYEPNYPEPWATQQQEQDIKLERLVPGETCLSHNGTWRLDFNSPFYRFLMDWMDNDQLE